MRVVVKSLLQAMKTSTEHRDVEYAMVEVDDLQDVLNVVESASRFIADLKSRYPNEDFKCPFVKSLSLDLDNLG